jgi:hypothetical protein
MATIARRTDRIHDAARSNSGLMIGDQSRTLSVGDRVCWGDTTTDLGTVVGAAWDGVTIKWDDGHTASIRHNDMAQVEQVPMKPTRDTGVPGKK